MQTSFTHTLQVSHCEFFYPKLVGVLISAKLLCKIKVKNLGFSPGDDDKARSITIIVFKTAHSSQRAQVVMPSHYEIFVYDFAPFCVRVLPITFIVVKTIA